MPRSLPSRVPRLPQSWLGRVFALLALGVVVLDAISLFGSPTHRRRGPAMFQAQVVALAGGTLRVTRGQFVPAGEGWSWGPRWHRVWFPGGHTAPSPMGGTVFRMTLPLWIVWGPLAFAAWKFDRRFVARWRQPGQCLGCGYDMTGLPEAAVCPECGGWCGRAAARP
jgi:hypothetical protein